MRVPPAPDRPSCETLTCCHGYCGDQCRCFDRCLIDARPLRASLAGCTSHIMPSSHVTRIVRQYRNRTEMARHRPLPPEREFVANHRSHYKIQGRARCPWGRDDRTPYLPFREAVRWVLLKDNLCPARRGLQTVSLMMLVLRRLRVKSRPCALRHANAKGLDRPRPAASDAGPREFCLAPTVRPLPSHWPQFAPDPFPVHRRPSDGQACAVAPGLFRAPSPRSA